MPCMDDDVGEQEDIVAVNQIFKDLGMLVHEQADVIGSSINDIISATLQ